MRLVFSPELCFGFSHPRCSLGSERQLPVTKLIGTVIYLLRCATAPLCNTFPLQRRFRYCCVCFVDGDKLQEIATLYGLRTAQPRTKLSAALILISELRNVSGLSSKPTCTTLGSSATQVAALNNPWKNHVSRDRKRWGLQYSNSPQSPQLLGHQAGSLRRPNAEEPMRFHLIALYLDGSIFSLIID